MHAQNVLALGIIIVLIFVTLFCVMKYYRDLAGWDQNIDPHYTPTVPVDLEVAKKVKRIRLEFFALECNNHRIDFHSDGTSIYSAFCFPPLPATGVYGRRLGRYVGHTSEFPNLASWILTPRVLESAKLCRDKEKSYLAISATVSTNGHEKTITACALPSRDYSTFDPLMLSQDAIEKVASRIRWQEERK